MHQTRYSDLGRRRSNCSERIAVGDEIVVLSLATPGGPQHLDRSIREEILNRAEQGVFSTRSASRPNPIGLHRVRVLGIDGIRRARERPRGNRRNTHRRSESRFSAGLRNADLNTAQPTGDVVIARSTPFTNAGDSSVDRSETS